MTLVPKADMNLLHGNRKDQSIVLRQLQNPALSAIKHSAQSITAGITCLQVTKAIKGGKEP